MVIIKYNNNNNNKFINIFFVRHGAKALIRNHLMSTLSDGSCHCSILGIKKVSTEGLNSHSKLLTESGSELLHLILNL